MSDKPKPERLSFRVEEIPMLYGEGTQKAIRPYSDPYGRYITIHEYRAVKREKVNIEGRLDEAVRLLERAHYFEGEMAYFLTMLLNADPHGVDDIQVRAYKLLEERGEHSKELLVALPAPTPPAGECGTCEGVGLVNTHDDPDGIPGIEPCPDCPRVGGEGSEG